LINSPHFVSLENYTHAGFAKVQTPTAIQALLQSFWETNHMETNSRQEVWDSSNTYVNHWEAPTSMLDISRDDPNIPNPLSHQDRWDLVKGVQSILEAWTKSPLVLTSLYGIRVYHEGSILAPHVDRLPLVSSAIINIAQDVDDPWILEVIGHNGKAHNLTMQPGEMVLYESHSVIHGRPFPLKGRYYANLFVHFEPLGHTLRHAEKQKDTYEYSETKTNDLSTSAQAAYEKAFQMEQLKNSQEGEGAPTKSKSRKPFEIPHYVPPDKEIRWNQHFDYDTEPRVSRS
jgi:prolyl 4-hydroxylase